MRRAVAGVFAAALILIAAGCGGPSKRAQVSDYFKQVDRIQKQMKQPITDANSAYQYFATASTSQSERVKLRRAEATIHKLRRRIAAVAAPDEAQKIRGDLLALMDGEATFAHDVWLLGKYTPLLGHVLAHAGQVGARLQASLKTTSAETQAQAFDAYAAVLKKDVAELRKLSPPNVVLGAHRAQIKTFTTSASLCRRIATALRNRDRTALPTLIQQLTNLSSLSARKRVHRTQVTAVKAFNKRLVALNRIAARIQRERVALERKL